MGDCRLYPRAAIEPARHIERRAAGSASDAGGAKVNQPLLPAFDRAQRIAVVVGIIGLVVCIVGLFVNSALVMQSYLCDYLYWVGISLGCLGLLMIQFTVKGTWGLAIRRLSEAGALTTPLMAALFIPILLGAGVLYPWARPDVVANDALLQQKSVYLNIPFYIVRAVLFFALWSALAFTLRRWSLRGVTEPDPGLVHRLQTLRIFGFFAFRLPLPFPLLNCIISVQSHSYPPFSSPSSTIVV